MPIRAEESKSWGRLCRLEVKKLWSSFTSLGYKTTKWLLPSSSSPVGLQYGRYDPSAECRSGANCP